MVRDGQARRHAELGRRDEARVLRAEIGNADRARYLDERLHDRAADAQAGRWPAGRARASATLPSA
ncbi:MAG: hypothetical protein MZW92_32880 [Comamonadaceae bacterium]|nr:hypothetical protein [Comamonadaceae bacterium]